MYTHALGEGAGSRIAVVEAMAKMQAKSYQATGSAMHFPKDEQCPGEYQCWWCRVRPIIKHQHRPVGYGLTSLLNGYERGHIIFVHSCTLTSSAVRTALYCLVKVNSGKW